MSYIYVTPGVGGSNNHGNETYHTIIILWNRQLIQAYMICGNHFIYVYHIYKYEKGMAMKKLPRKSRKINKKLAKFEEKY